MRAQLLGSSYSARTRSADALASALARLRLPWRRGFLERRAESRLPRLRTKTFRNIAATERSASRLRPTTGDSIAATDIPIRTRVLPVGLAWLIWRSITAEPTSSSRCQGFSGGFELRLGAAFSPRQRRHVGHLATSRLSLLKT